MTNLVTTNPGFETGNLTGWATGGTSDGLVYVDSSVGVPEGTYACEFSWDSGGYTTSGNLYISQAVTLADATQLTFYARWISDGNNKGILRVYLDSDVIYTYNESGGSHLWVNKSVDISAYSGSKTLKFELTIPADTVIVGLGLDFADIEGTITPPGPSPISFPTVWDPKPASTGLGSFTYNGVCKDYWTFASERNDSYGTGSVILEFSTVDRTPTAVATLTMDTDIFNYEFTTDYSRLYTIVYGKGTKFCGA